MTPKKKTYEDVIGMLHEEQHRAPAGWDKIAEELDFADHFSQLKAHRVEKDLWTGIEEALGEKIVVENPRGRIFRMGLRYAAAVVLVLGVVLMVWQNQKSDFYAYHSEVEYVQDLDVVNDFQDVTFAKGTNYLTKNSFLFSEEKINEYQTQLQELEGAITEIQSMQEQYGVDAEGVKLLAKMERQKANLIKSMINQP